jgi:hypothetical protein
LLVAEVTRPSLGVGYEIGKATEWGLKVMCLYRPSVTPSLSAMIAGSNSTVHQYDDPAELSDLFTKHFNNAII